MNASLLWLLCFLCSWGVVSIVKLYQSAAMWRREALDARQIARWERERCQHLERIIEDMGKRKRDGVYR